MSAEPAFADFADGTDFILVPYSATDREGKTSFFAYWIGWVGYAGDEIGIKGQVFHTDIAEHAAQTESRGKRVVVWDGSLR